MKVSNLDTVELAEVITVSDRLLNAALNEFFSPWEVGPGWRGVRGETMGGGLSLASGAGRAQCPLTFFQLDFKLWGQVWFPIDESLVANDLI